MYILILVTPQIEDAPPTHNTSGKMPDMHQGDGKWLVFPIKRFPGREGQDSKQIWKTAEESRKEMLAWVLLCSLCEGGVRVSILARHEWLDLSRRSKGVCSIPNGSSGLGAIGEAGSVVFETCQQTLGISSNY